MMTVVTGGSKCGKSSFAESMLDGFDNRKLYIATMRPYGEEALTAIERHRRLRSKKGFETIERYTDIGGVSLPEGCGILLECMGNLCANEMFRDDRITDPFLTITDGIRRLREYASKLIIVTNTVCCDGISYEYGTSEYIRVLSRINTILADMSDNVIECVYGIPVVLKGKLS